MAGSGEVFPRPAGDLEIGVLEDVGRVDPPLQPPVEAEPDHPPQPLAVSGEQLGQGPLVPAFEAEEQVVIVSLVLVGHGYPPFQLNCAPAPIVHRLPRFSDIRFG